MSRRAATAEIYHPAEDAVSASDFDPNDDKGPEIPPDLDANVRGRVLSILEENPYLTQAQMEAIVRLATMYARFDELQKEIDLVGVKVFDVKKELEVPNPMLAAQMSVQSHIITQERNLAISIPTRNEQIDKRDRKPRKKTAEQAPGARKLRIA